MADHIACTVRKLSVNRKWDRAIKPYASVPSYLLPPARLCLPKVLQPSKTAPPTGDQMVEHIAYGGNFTSKQQHKVYNVEQHILKIKLKAQVKTDVVAGPGAGKHQFQGMRNANTYPLSLASNKPSCVYHL